MFSHIEKLKRGHTRIVVSRGRRASTSSGGGMVAFLIQIGREIIMCEYSNVLAIRPLKKDH